MDERFRENAARAQLKAYKIGFAINFIAFIIFSQGYILKNAEYTLGCFNNNIISVAGLVYIFGRVPAVPL